MRRPDPRLADRRSEHGGGPLPTPLGLCVGTDAQLLWDSKGFAARLKRFAPCVGDVSAEFEPKLGVDVFPENQLKTVGTLGEYSRSVAPASVGLDPKTLQCVAKPGELYQGLNATQRARAARSEAYLRRLASLDWYGA